MSNARKLADNLPSVGQFGNRNLVINGQMSVSQRGSIPAIQTGYGACDRFRLASNSAARFDTSQSTDVPSGQGFSNSLKLDCSTADTSVAAGDYYLINHMIEGQNLQHLLYGSSSAKQCTLSFWVKSPKTGIHNLEIESVDGGVFNIHQYTIASANTWQNVKITFDGYQTTAIANDNTSGLVINWWLLAGTTFSGGSYSANTWSSTNANRAVGQVNVADSTSNNFYLTGVQLEIGGKETPFEHEPISVTLAKCQRYFIRYDGNAEFVCQFYSTSSGDFNVATPVTMRTTPTLTTKDKENTANKISLYSSGYSHGHDISIITSRSIGNIMTLRIAGISSGVVGVNEAVQVQFNDLRLDAEI